MTFTAAFNPDTGAVEMSCSNLAAGVTWVTFYYWLGGATTIDVVRGAYRIPVNSGSTTLISHHDWPPGTDGAPDLMYGAYTSAGVWDGQRTIAPRVEDQAWLKWLGFPFLNRRVRIVDFTAPQRNGRGNLLGIIASRTPTAVQEVMGPLSFDLVVRTETWDEWRDLDRALSVGGVMMLHADEAALGLPAVYFTIDAVKADRRGRRNSPTRHTTISLNEVSAPSYYYAGASSSWQSVLNTYSTWSALLAAQPTWASVLNMPASADDVVVG